MKAAASAEMGCEKAMVASLSMPIGSTESKPPGVRMAPAWLIPSAGKLSVYARSLTKAPIGRAVAA